MQAFLSTTYFGPVQWYQKLCRCSTVYMERCDSYRKQTYRNRCVIAAANGPQVLTVPVERPSGSGKLLTRDVRISDHGNWRHLHWHALMSAYSESPFFDYYADDLRPFFERRWEFLFDFNEAIRATLCSLLDIHPNVRPTTRYVGNEELRVMNEENLQPGQGVGNEELRVKNEELRGVGNEELRIKNEELRVKDEENMRAGQGCADAGCGDGAARGASPAIRNSSFQTPNSQFVTPNSSLVIHNSSFISDFRDAIDPKHPLPDADFEPRPYYQVFASRHGFMPNLSVLDLLFNMGPEGIFWLV